MQKAWLLNKSLQLLLRDFGNHDSVQNQDNQAPQGKRNSGRRVYGRADGAQNADNMHYDAKPYLLAHIQAIVKNGIAHGESNHPDEQNDCEYNSLCLHEINSLHSFIQLSTP